MIHLYLQIPAFPFEHIGSSLSMLLVVAFERIEHRRYVLVDKSARQENPSGGASLQSHAFVTRSVRRPGVSLRVNQHSLLKSILYQFCTRPVS
jgi:hypothetical protein